MPDLGFGFEPRWCESRIYDDTFLAERQTQGNQTLKSHLPTALTLIPGKEPGGAISFTTKDQHKNIAQHHLFIPLESWALCIHEDAQQLMHGANWLRETVAPRWKSAPKREGMSLRQAQFPQTSVLHNLPSLRHFCCSYMIPMLSA